jgi:hypothetical protein
LEAFAFLGSVSLVVSGAFHSGVRLKYAKVAPHTRGMSGHVAEVRQGSTSHSGHVAKCPQPLSKITILGTPTCTTGVVFTLSGIRVLAPGPIRWTIATLAAALPIALVPIDRPGSSIFDVFFKFLMLQTHSSHRAEGPSSPLPWRGDARNAVTLSVLQLHQGPFS